MTTFLTEKAIQNAVIIQETERERIQEIAQPHNNIAICERDISHLQQGIQYCIAQNVTIKACGDIEQVMDQVNEALPSPSVSVLLDDVAHLMQDFLRLTDSDSFKLLLTVVDTNMCRKFHTDINDLRLLCTYSGQGTLWLPNEAVNYHALQSSQSNNEGIVKDNNAIQQAPTGAIVILKGAIYPQEKSHPIVHRSPSIEGNQEKRLLLRIDTNEFLKI